MGLEIRDSDHVYYTPLEEEKCGIIMKYRLVICDRTCR